MNKSFSYADLFTTTRIFAVAIFGIIVAYEPEIFSLIPGIVIIIAIFLTDTIDGLIARALKEDDKFGGFYDIVGDRVAELGLLVPFVYLNIASPIILMYFIVKDFIVDYKRLKGTIITGDSPFKQIKNPLGKFLIGSPLLRTPYSAAKIVMFCLFYASIFKEWNELETATTISVIIVITLSILRSAPPLLTSFGQETTTKV